MKDDSNPDIRYDQWSVNLHNTLIVGKYRAGRTLGGHMLPGGPDRTIQEDGQGERGVLHVGLVRLVAVVTLRITTLRKSLSPNRTTLILAHMCNYSAALMRVRASPSFLLGHAVEARYTREKDSEQSSGS